MNRQEVRTLGRLGQPLSGGSYRPRRRLRASRPIVAALVVIVGAVTWVGMAVERQVPASNQPRAAAFADVPDRPGADDRASRAADRDSGERRDTLEAFATVEGLSLVTPHASPITIAFHEASRAEALSLVPLGTLLANDNPLGFREPVDVPGPEYRVLSSRGRGRPATSAVDVVVPLGDAIVAPVSGEVTAVSEYPLYGRTRDWRIEIAPEDRPDLRIVIIHLLAPGVEVGDAVTAGETSLGVARLLAFDSHVDYVTDAKHPHAHIEVKAAVSEGTVDPNQPAVPASHEDL